MRQFSIPSNVTFQDPVGSGYWDIAHHRQHLQYVQILSTQTPAVLIPDFDFIQMLSAGAARGSIVESHMVAHTLLRQILNVQGVDLAQFDLNKSDDFYNWMGYHDSDHAAFDAALGIS
jgi:hypothetical protein